MASAAHGDPRDAATCMGVEGMGVNAGVATRIQAFLSNFSSLQALLAYVKEHRTYFSLQE